MTKEIVLLSEKIGIDKDKHRNRFGTYLEFLKSYEEEFAKENPYYNSIRQIKEEIRNVEYMLPPDVGSWKTRDIVAFLNLPDNADYVKFIRPIVQAKCDGEQLFLFAGIHQQVTTTHRYNVYYC
jgi:hypothetical protein